MLRRLLLLAMIVALWGCSHCNAPRLCRADPEPLKGINPLDVR